MNIFLHGDKFFRFPAHVAPRCSIRLWRDGTLFRCLAPFSAAEFILNRETKPELWIMKIEGSCPSWFFMIFRGLPTESWMRSRIFYWAVTRKMLARDTCDLTLIHCAGRKKKRVDKERLFDPYNSNRLGLRPFRRIRNGQCELCYVNFKMLFLLS